jgi:hypothetical protein
MWPECKHNSGGSEELAEHNVKVNDVEFMALKKQLGGKTLKTSIQMQPSS